MRLFVAVDVPAAERDRVLAATRALRTADLPVRWIEPAAFHLTLKFLGAVSDSAPIAATLGDVCARHRPFTLQLRGAGAFPGALWIGVSPAPALLALQRDLEQSLEPLGFPAEARAYAPHLTIARVKRGERLSRMEPLLAEVRYEAEFTVETVDLMRSHLSAHGARYERLLAVELAA